jgi:hypothetical protein
MSLIGDALRKTRQEEAERESERKGVLFSAKIANPPTRSNLGLGLALGAVIAVAATVAGGGAVWWLLSRGEAAQPQATGSAPAVVGQGIETDEAAHESLPPSSVGLDEPITSTPATGHSGASTTAAGPTELESEQPTAQPDFAVETAAGAASETTEFEGGFIGVEDGADVYILDANLGRVELSLGYIIFRADDPFAEINGVELHLGGVIEGYRVKAIERDRVLLSNGRKDIVLRTP